MKLENQHIEGKNSTQYYTRHTILTSPHHITYTNDNGTKETLIYNITYPKITASTNVTEQNIKILQYFIETNNFLSFVII